MATKTSKYEFNKPEQNDFYDVDVQNENWDKVDEELSEFDDSGVTEDIKSFPDFLTKFVTGNKVAVTLRNLKAGLQFVLHAGQIVNNCVTDNAGLPLSAAQGKVLKDLYTQLYSDSQALANNLSKINPAKQYVSNVDVVTTIRALIAKGESCGNILFAGTSNTGLPSGYNTGSVEYYNPDGSSTVYLKFSFDKKRYDGSISGSAITPTWLENATKDDIPTRYGNTGIEIPAGKSCKISVTKDGLFAALLFVQGTTGNGFGTFMIQGYGVDGGPSRYRVNSLNTSGTTSGITCTVGDGAYFMVKNDTNNKVRMVFEEFFNDSNFTHSII